MYLSGEALVVVVDLKEALLIIYVLVFVLSRKMGQLNFRLWWRLALSHRTLFQVAEGLLFWSFFGLYVHVKIVFPRNFFAFLFLKEQTTIILFHFLASFITG